MNERHAVVPSPFAIASAVVRQSDWTECDWTECDWTECDWTEGDWTEGDWTEGGLDCGFDEPPQPAASSAQATATSI